MPRPLAPGDLVAVIGAGAMGTGIAEVAALAGQKVVVCDVSEDALGAARARLEKSLEGQAAKGRMTAEAARAAAGRVSWSRGLSGATGAALAIEAILEDLAAKRALFAELEARLEGHALLATNTSSLSVTALGKGLTAPERLVGMHFFNPALVMKLVEIVAGLATAPEAADAARATAQSWGKVAVLARDVPGFIVNRIARPYYGEAFRALREGVADAASIDHVMRECGGFRMGPFELADLIGHDVNAAVARSIFEAYHGETRFIPSTLQESLVAAGRLGRKAGRGVYDYAEGADRPQPTLAAAQGEPPERVTPPRDADPAMMNLCAFLRQADPVTAQEAPPPSAPFDPDFIAVDGVRLIIADGRTATSYDRRWGERVVQIDLARDYAAASTVALAASAQCSEAAFFKVAALFQSAGKAVIRLADRPGLVVMRTVCQLANAAADALRDRVASPGDIDRAMMFGVNYPQGPLAWADALGVDVVHEALANLREVTGEARYAPSEPIARALEARRPLAEAAT